MGRSQESITNAAVAIDKDKNSQFAVKWALDNLNLSGSITLLHVNTQPSSSAPVPKEGRAPNQDELKHFFLPYRGYCARKGVRVKEIILQDSDVAGILAEYVIDNSIGAIVLGASSRSALTRAFKNQDIQANLIRSIPDFCSVHVISKTKSQLVKAAKRSPTPNSFLADSRPFSNPGSSLSETPFSDQFYSQGSWASADSDGNSSGMYSARSNEFAPATSRSSHSKITSPQHSASIGHLERFMPRDMQSNSSTSPHPVFSGSSESSHAPPWDKPSNSRSTLPHPVVVTGTPMNWSHGNKLPPSQTSFQSSNVNIHTQGSASNFHSSSSSHSSKMSFDLMDQSRISDSSRSSSSPLPNLGDVEDEMNRLRQELKHTMELYNSACREAIAAKDKAMEMGEGNSAQEAALIMVEMEKTKCKVAIEAAQMAQRLAELEGQKRKQAEMKFLHEAEEKKKAIDALARCDIRYRKYTIEEIEGATNHFSTAEKIGEGGYGPVFKAYLDHTAVAIKVLRPDISQGQQQFQREIEVLSRMRHPNMVLLLGACPEYGCLVYEFMENGSLEDRLFCKNGSSPIPWGVRFRIAAEIATALLFLHQTRPEPLVHRDLKPANILLDRNFVSKIGDVGLSRLVPSSVADTVTQYHMTAAAGTFCYIDPEYQQTGMLGTKSDIYSLGVVLLQLLTAKPAIGLTYQIEESIEQGTFANTLDLKVDDWPVEEALTLAKLALQCCELRKKDRPDLGTVVLPVLERLRDLGYGAEGTA